MRRDVITILAITAIVVVATLVVAPQLSQIEFGKSEPANSIPIAPQREEHKPLAEPSDLRNKPKKQFVHVKGTLTYEEWGCPVSGSVHLEWEIGTQSFTSSSAAVASDGIIDLQFDRPPFPFRVVVSNSRYQPTDTWESATFDANTVNLGEVRIDVEVPPVLLKFSRHYGETRPDGHVKIYSVATDPPTFVADEGDSIAPGRYLVRYTGVTPTWYKEVEVGSDFTTVELPIQGDYFGAHVQVVLHPPIEAPPMRAVVSLHALEPYGFRRRVERDTTNRTGEMFIPWVAKGRYIVTVDYGDPMLSRDTILSPNEKTVQTAEVEVLEPGTQCVEFDGYVLGDVSVLVTRRGEPVRGHEVSVSGSGDYAARPFRRKATTDDDGLASFGVLKWETARIEISNNWRSHVGVPGTRESANAVHVELQPEGTGNLSARLKVAEGVNIRKGLSLTLTHDETGESRRIKSSAGDQFSLQGLPLGHYHLRAEWRTSPVWYAERFQTMNWHFRIDSPELLELQFSIAHGAAEADISPFVDPRHEPKYETRLSLYSYQESQTGWLHLSPSEAEEFCRRLAPGRYALLVSTIHATDVFRRVAYAIVEVEAGQTTRVSWKVLPGLETWPDEVPAQR